MTMKALSVKTLPTVDLILFIGAGFAGYNIMHSDCRDILARLAGEDSGNVTAKIPNKRGFDSMAAQSVIIMTNRPVLSADSTGVFNIPEHEGMGGLSTMR